MVLPNQSSPDAACTCRHSIDCNCECHGRHCDPTEHVCSIEFLPDEGGLTPWGCPECSPGVRLAHLADCPAIVVVVPAAPAAIVSDAAGGSAPSAR
jgi:hypothetical protein